MPWVETESLSFAARHEAKDEESAQRILDRLEELRLRLEDRFERVPGGLSVIVHDHPAWLAMAHPYLPLVRAASAKAGRRYLAGWPMAREIHVLNDDWTELRAAGEDSERALRGTADRLYIQIVLAANNPGLPPDWTPRRFARYMRWAWLVEGAAQYFSGQVPLFRAAVSTRLREGGAPNFPPSARDAVLLGGTVFDLLDDALGPSACELLVSRLRREGPEGNLQLAFEAPLREIERAWRLYLDDVITRRSADSKPRPHPPSEEIPRLDELGGELPPRG
jgi:hypothetical protein